MPASLIDRLDVVRRTYRPMWSKTAPLWLPVVCGAALGTLAFQTDGQGDVFTAAESFTLGAIVGAGSA